MGWYQHRVLFFFFFFFFSSNFESTTTDNWLFHKPCRSTNKKSRFQSPKKTRRKKTRKNPRKKWTIKKTARPKKRLAKRPQKPRSPLNLLSSNSQSTAKCTTL